MIGAILCVLVIVLLARYIKKRNEKYEGVRYIPGPPTLPFLGNIFDFGFNKSEILTNLVRLNERYGPMFKLWMGPTCVNLVVSGPEYIEKILVTKAINDKGPFYKFAGDWLGDAFPITSGAKWYWGRIFVAPFFNAINVEKFIPVFNANANKFVDGLKKLDLETQVNLDDHIMSCTLDNIMQTMICATYDEQSKQTFQTNWKTQCDVIVSRTFSMFTRFGPIFMMTGNYRAQKKWAAEANKLLNDIITDRKQERLNIAGETGSKTLLDVLLDRCEVDDSYSLRNVVEDINAVIAAGSETTAVVLLFCVYQLSKHPEVQAKLSKEIEEVLGPDTDVTMKAIHKMKYLDCVLKETMRLFTPVPMIERTIAEDIILDDRRVPKGTSVLIFLMGAHRNEQRYPEPDKFNPDRFLPEISRNGGACSFVPFSVGPRNCLGQKFGMTEAKIIMCKIMKSFEIDAVQRHEPKLELEVVLKSANGLPVLLKPKQLAETTAS